MVVAISKSGASKQIIRGLELFRTEEAEKPELILSDNKI